MKLSRPYCGTDNTFDDSLYGQNIECGACGKIFVGKPASVSSPVPTVSSSVRKGITDAKFNEGASDFVFGESIILSISAGWAAHSWWCFGGVFLGLLIIIHVPQIVRFICWIAAIAWGAFGFWVGKSLVEDMGAAVVLFVVLGLAGYGIHAAGAQWFQDLGDS